MGFANVIWSFAGPLLGLLMAGLALRFSRDGERVTARKLFFFTLLYLPAALLLLLLAWRPR